VGDTDTRLLISHARDNSFPSDHTAVAAAAAMVAALAWPRWGWMAVVGAVLIGLARVFVGVHFPGDVAAGLAIGGVAAVAGWAAASRLHIERVHWPRLAR
jgi:undecaprenyl-diphosphatase